MTSTESTEVKLHLNPSPRTNAGSQWHTEFTVWLRLSLCQIQSNRMHTNFWESFH